MEDGLLAPVMHIEGAEAIDPNFESWTWLSDERSRTHACIPEEKFAAVS